MCNTGIMWSTILVGIIFLYGKILTEPIIISNIYPSCRIPSDKGHYYTNKIEHASTEDHEFFLNLCENLPGHYCGENVKVCVRKKSNKLVVLTANKFVYSDDSIEFNGTNKCDLSVKLMCSYELIKQPQLLVLDKCMFEIRLLKHQCNNLCIARLHNNVINFEAIRGIYYNNNSVDKFSVGICMDVNENCSNCATSCVNDVSISTFSSEQFLFDKDIVYRGHHGKRYKMYVRLKCNWDKRVPEMRLIPNRQRGLKYQFTMETDYGCVKTPPKCHVLTEDFYLYNFTELSKKTFNISISNNSILHINLCGSLPILHPNCSYAQICEQAGSKFINKGRLQDLVKITTGQLKYQYNMIFTEGDVCEGTNNEFHSTRIEFECDRFDTGPTFVRNEKCLTILSWRTPHACPTQDEKKCLHHHHVEEHDNKNKCSVEYDGNVYNFTGLTHKNGGYKVKSDKDATVEYLLNICDNVYDKEVPCMKKSILTMKNLTVPDISKKIASLGTTHQFQVIDMNTIRIKILGGDLCDDGSFRYYKSHIDLKCNDHEEEPTFIEKSSCTYNFYWKTPFACPKKNLHHCIIRDSINSHNKYNFTDLKNKLVKFDVNTTTYLFDLCNNTSICPKEKNCVHATINKTVISNEGNFIYFNISKPCIGDNTFDKAVIEIKCDLFTNNDHYVFKNVVDCVLKLELITALVCNETVEPPIYKSEKRIEEKTEKLKLPNCSITNNSTGYSLNISTLKLNISWTSCPNYTMKDEDSLTELRFLTNVSCINSASNETYLVTLKCPDGSSNNSIKFDLNQNQCARIFNLEDAEYCRLLEKQIKQNSVSVAGITVSILVVLVVLTVSSVFALRVHKKRRLNARMRALIKYDKEF